MKRNHKRRKGSPRSQYSFFDYILVIGVVALITGGVYYFAKAFYEPETSQVATSAKKSEEIKPKALVIEAEDADFVDVKAEENTEISEITVNTLKAKPLPENGKKKKLKRTKPREKMVRVNHEVNTEDTEKTHTVTEDQEYGVPLEPEPMINTVEPVELLNTTLPEASNEVSHEEPAMTIEPANTIEPAINIHQNQVPQAEVVASESNTTEQTPAVNVNVQPLDAEDILPQFFDTIRDDKADVLEELINLYSSGDRGIDIKAVSSKFEYNALHFAAMTGKLECLRVILRHKDVFNFQVDDRSNDGLTNTPLLLACYNAEYFPEVAVEVIGLLLDHGADIELKDAEGYSPLLAAVQSSHLGVVNLLLDRNANVRFVHETCKYTVLHHAMEYCNRPVLKTLIDHGADLHAVNMFNREPIHEAAAFGCVDGLRELILTRRVDKQTRSPLREEQKYHPNVVTECLFGATPLHYAAYFAKLPAVEFLFLIQAQFHAEDQRGRKAAWYADNLYNSKKLDRVEVFYYFEDRYEWENDEKKHFDNQLRQKEDEIRRLDESPNPERLAQIKNNFLHKKREFKC